VAGRWENRRKRKALESPEKEKTQNKEREIRNDLKAPQLERVTKGQRSQSG